MIVVEPGKGQLLVEHVGRRLRITTAPAAQDDVVVSLLLAMPFLALFIVLMIRDLFAGRYGQGPVTLLVLFGPVLIFALGINFLKVLLWELAGRETIELNSILLWQHKQIPLFGRISRTFAVPDITNMCLAPPPTRVVRSKYRPVVKFGFEKGAIAFDLGGVTHYIGQGLDEAEARYVLDEICKRVKRLSA